MENMKKLWSMPHISEIEVKMTEGYWTKDAPGTDGLHIGEATQGDWKHHS